MTSLVICPHCGKPLQKSEHDLSPMADKDELEKESTRAIVIEAVIIVLLFFFSLYISGTLDAWLPHAYRAKHREGSSDHEAQLAAVAAVQAVLPLPYKEASAEAVSAVAYATHNHPEWFWRRAQHWPQSSWPPVNPKPRIESVSAMHFLPTYAHAHARRTICGEHAQLRRHSGWKMQYT